MKPWLKDLLAVIGILLAIPLIPIVFIAFMLFVFYPLQHKVLVMQADRANARAWESVDAHAATLEIDVFHNGEKQTLSTDIICYEGQKARPWSFKDGPPRKYTSTLYSGPESLEIALEGGALVFIEIDRLCSHHQVEPTNRSDFDLYIVNTTSTRFCRGLLQSGWTGWTAPDLRVSPPRLSDVTDAPLRTLIARDELKSASTGWSSGFRDRFGTRMGQAIWRSQDACWVGDGGLCDPELTALCPARAP